MLAVALSSSAFADDASARKNRIDEGRNQALVKGLVTGAVGAAGIGGAHKYLQLSGEVHAVFQAANFLYSLGVLADSAAIQDFGPRALLAGLTAYGATHPVVKSSVESVAGIGQYVQQAGKVGETMTAIALYKLTEIGYEKLRDNTSLGKWIISDSKMKDLAGE